MEDLMQCPMCFGGVPRGAVVCRGCKARIEYGVPAWAAVILLLVSVSFGWWSGFVLAGWVGWIGGLALFFLAGAGLNHLFRNRVVFRLR
ncbi:hypothetical protein LRM36_06265 [Stenotrophomonas maltophilia]|nr:hypothetical protein [Stenotrophomonas maltophilia]